VLFEEGFYFIAAVKFKSAVVALLLSVGPSLAGISDSGQMPPSQGSSNEGEQGEDEDEETGTLAGTGGPADDPCCGSWI